MDDGYRVQLLPAECAPGAVFHPLHCWLDANLARYDFFRPYGTFRGGVRPEPWHVSFAPISEPALRSLTREVLAAAIESSDMLGKPIRKQEHPVAYLRRATLPRGEQVRAHHRGFVGDRGPGGGWSRGLPSLPLQPSGRSRSRRPRRVAGRRPLGEPDLFPGSGVRLRAPFRSSQAGSRRILDRAPREA